MNLEDAVGQTISSMAGIISIVVEMYDDPELMARHLRVFAIQGGHDIGWVAKKAHEAMYGIEWERHHADLNQRLDLPEDFTG